MPRYGASLAAMKFRNLAVLPLAATLIAGCGGSKLTGSSIEKLLMANITRGYPGATVDCPDVDNEVGKTFTCDVKGVKGVSKIEGKVAEGDKVDLVRTLP
jgi:hypothetical protein